MELELLKSGALTSARILKSTGFKRLDDAVYRAALAASPYPEPPSAKAGGNRFEVELIFAPKRF
ncbi:energy transducer TonB [Marinobacter sp. CAU 1620]|nr:energy transducer TonB [Marinobacter arenosus]